MNAPFEALRTLAHDPARDVASMWPSVRAWMCAPAAAGADHGRFIEVGVSLGAGKSPHAAQLPPRLSPDRDWYWVCFARQTPGRSAIVLWFAPTAGLQALRARPDWRHDETLGLDFVASSANEADALFSSPLVAELFGAIASAAPAAVELRPSAEVDDAHHPS